MCNINNSSRLSDREEETIIIWIMNNLTAIKSINRSCWGNIDTIRGIFVQDTGLDHITEEQFFEIMLRMDWFKRSGDYCNVSAKSRAFDHTKDEARSMK